MIKLNVIINKHCLKEAKKNKINSENYENEFEKERIKKEQEEKKKEEEQKAFHDMIKERKKINKKKKEEISKFKAKKEEEKKEKHAEIVKARQERKKQHREGGKKFILNYYKELEGANQFAFDNFLGLIFLNLINYSFFIIYYFSFA